MKSLQNNSVMCFEHVASRGKDQMKFWADQLQICSMLQHENKILKKNHQKYVNLNSSKILDPKRNFQKNGNEQNLYNMDAYFRAYVSIV